MPKLEKITVERKFSKCVRRDGLEEWHSVTHAAEATALQGETYEMAEQTLDEEVRRGLVQAYATMRRGSQTSELAQEAVGDEEIDELAQLPHQEESPAPPVDPSWCDIHKCKMKKRSWGGYSHKIGEQWCQGHWCAAHQCQLYKNEKDGSVWYSHTMQDPDTGETVWCQGEAATSLENESPEDAGPVEYMEEIPF